MHTFAVEKGVGHDLQINMDMVIKMRCADVHVNVQDAAGDRILAGEKLKKDPTSWGQWVDGRGIHRLGKDAHGRVITGEGYHDEGFGEEHVHDIIAAAGGRRAKFSKTPRLRGRGGADSCRLYGSLDVNKVQGDFHITARGHGYVEVGTAHLDHSGISLSSLVSGCMLILINFTAFNFSHIISELSFGAFYPTLLNPLDRTVEETANHFHKFQYFMSVVPTVYSTPSRTLYTNQYAVTEQSYMIGERDVPGVFFKYDIEPMLLSVEESRRSFLRLVVTIVNIFSGVLVAGHWGFTMTEWALSVLRKRRRMSEGVLSGRPHDDD